MLCIYYKKLNKVTIKNMYLLSRIRDLFNQLKGETMFSKIDLRSGHHHIHIIEEDIYNTAFWTRYEHYYFVVVPFGLTDAPSTFMCWMNSVLRPCLEKIFIQLIDDILVYSKNEEEHVKHLGAMLRLLRQHKLYVKLSNCNFFYTEVHYLGHVISKESIAVDPKKIRAIMEW